MTALLAERLAAGLVRMPNGCLEWTGNISGNGYGRLFFGGEELITHRLAWELANGPIPEGLIVCHHCDNPPCADVTHLFLGTHAENAADRDAKGRQRHAGNEKKTRCPQGHPYDEANTYRYKGRRQCRPCNAAAVNRSKARKQVAS